MFVSMIESGSRSESRSGFKSGARGEPESVSESRFRSESGYITGFLRVLRFPFAVTLDP